MKFAVCNEIYGNDWVKTCQLAKAAGFTGVEIAPHTFFKDSVLEVTAAQRTEIKKVAADHGLTICALHMCLFSPKGLHINGPDAALRAKTVEYLGHITQFAIDLGCPMMIYGSPPNPRRGARSRLRPSPRLVQGRHSDCAAQGKSRRRHDLY